MDEELKIKICAELDKSLGMDFITANHRIRTMFGLSEIEYYDYFIYWYNN